MKLLREVTKSEASEEDVEVQDRASPVMPEGGWNVGHLANHGILLSCEGFSMKLDINQLNALFDLAEDGESGEVKDHKGNAVYVEVMDKQIVLSRQGDKTYPHGVVVDLKTLKEMGIEEYETDEEEPQPDDDTEDDEDDDTIDPSDEEEELKEGVKRAFRRQGKKIKRGFRVTSGFRKGRVVANIRNAFKPRKKASTRMKLKVAARKKKIVRIMKAKRTRMKPLSKRLVRMNKR